MKSSNGGFTIVEILVAMVVLAIGVVALVSSSAMVTRMVGRGKTSTFAAQVAARRLERLRGVAASTATPCTAAAFVNGTESLPNENGNVTESWTIENDGAVTRKVTVFVTYKTVGGSGTKIDTVSTLIPCVS